MIFCFKYVFTNRFKRSLTRDERQFDFPLTALNKSKTLDLVVGSPSGNRLPSLPLGPRNYLFQCIIH